MGTTGFVFFPSVHLSYQDIMNNAHTNHIAITKRTSPYDDKKADVRTSGRIRAWRSWDKTTWLRRDREKTGNK
jgi:hypothetical protein